VSSYLILHYNQYIFVKLNVIADQVVLDQWFSTQGPQLISLP